jgi:hypothetical protein
MLLREIAAAQSQNKETEIVRKASSKRSAVRKVEISDAEKQLALKATERTAAAAPPGGRPPPPPGPSSSASSASSASGWW